MSLGDAFRSVPPCCGQVAVRHLKGLLGLGGLLGPGQIGPWVLMGLSAWSEAEVKPNTDRSGWDGWPWVSWGGREQEAVGRGPLQLQPFQGDSAVVRGTGQGLEVACWASSLMGCPPALPVGGGTSPPECPV